MEPNKAQLQKRTAPHEDEIDLIALFFEFLNHWKLIIVSAFLLACVGLIYSKFIITPLYSSTSELYVFTKSTSITSLSDLQLGSNLTNDYQEVIKDRPVLDQVIENLELDMDYKTLNQMVSINIPSNSRIIKITVKSDDPVLAKMIADEIADVSAAFISEKMDQDPPSVLSYGYIGTNPVNVSTMKNTVMGGLVGGFLACAVVTVMYLVNDTIITPDDIETKLGLHVLGSVAFDEDLAETDNASKKKGLFSRKTKRVGGLK